MDIIDKIIQREGGYSNDPDDSGGRTKYGISEVHEPEAWADGDVSLDEARAIYQRKYITQPGFDQLSGLLQEFMVDWGVTSGPVVATYKLQEALGTTVDGVIGPNTLAKLALADPNKLLNTLVDMRIISYIRIAQKRPKDLKYLCGWVLRALEFRR